ncbi:NAD(P)/FAD-dependent oxidoreductase [Desulfococcus sp.]|uniref:NAD(P)/FAD-dependent oxidoreductase n=1 Tax=Desulfococcus sp. TaxID=2025834 RepID=UPI0035940804
MGKHMVLVGGGHAHLTVLKNLEQFTGGGCRATVISRSAYHYYSGMGPGMLSGDYAPREIRFHVRKMTEDLGGRFIEDGVIRVAPGEQILYLKRGAPVPYDVVSFNTGSSVAFDTPAGPQVRSVFPAKPIENLLAAREAVRRHLKRGHLNLCVAGGGPAGIELSANLRSLVRKEGGRAEIVLVAGDRLLSTRPERRLKACVERELRRQEITVIEGRRLAALDEGRVVLSDGSTLQTDLVLLATGTRPSKFFRESGLATGDDGGLLVDETLRAVSHPTIFGGGDCIAFAPRPLAKIGVHAVRQNPILLHNLTAAVTGRQDYVKYKPQRTCLLILNMGDGRGVFVRNGLVFAGKTAFRLKNHIDRGFMKKFQVSGEAG